MTLVKWLVITQNYGWSLTHYPVKTPWVSAGRAEVPPNGQPTSRPAMSSRRAIRDAGRGPGASSALPGGAVGRKGSQH